MFRHTKHKHRAHSSEWAFCYLAFFTGWNVGFSKYSMLVLLAVAAIAFLWRFGRAAFTGVTKWILWALAALCACAGLIALLSSEGKPLPIVGGFILWAFTAYTIKVAGASLRDAGAKAKARDTGGSSTGGNQGRW